MVTAMGPPLPHCGSIVRLEPLTEKVSAEGPTDKGTAEMQEGGMEVVAAFEADEQASVAVQPGKVALDDPAVTTEFGAGLDALAGDARGDAATTEAGPPFPRVIRLVGMELVGAATRATSGRLDRWDGVNRVQELGALVDVRSRLEADQGDAPALAHQMIFRSWLAAIGWVRPHGLGGRPPFFPPLAGIVELAMLARLQSSRSASPKRSSSTRCNSH